VESSGWRIRRLRTENEWQKIGNEENELQENESQGGEEQKSETFEVQYEFWGGERGVT
jgi:hypothetical protein